MTRHILLFERKIEQFGFKPKNRLGNEVTYSDKEILVTVDYSNLTIESIQLKETIDFNYFPVLKDLFNRTFRKHR